MTEAASTLIPRRERSLFDLIGVRWRYARGTVRNMFIGRNFLYSKRQMGLTTGGEIEPTYFLELTTPKGPVAVAVSEKRSSLTEVGDTVPLKYRIGRRSGRIEARLDI